MSDVTFSHPSAPKVASENGSGCISIVRAGEFSVDFDILYRMEFLLGWGFTMRLKGEISGEIEIGQLPQLIDNCRIALESGQIKSDLVRDGIASLRLLASQAYCYSEAIEYGEYGE